MRKAVLTLAAALAIFAVGSLIPDHWDGTAPAQVVDFVRLA
jgi:hypothetical protein